MLCAAMAAPYPEASSVAGGRLAIGGCDAGALAEEFGTPAYVVAEDDLRARAREFRDAMAAHGGEVLFASKAFPCTAVLRAFAEEGLSVDVASGGELALARRAGFDADRIVHHGNAKSEAELADAVALGCRIVVDGWDELERLERLGRPARVLVRVTPGVVADTHHSILTGHAESKFGFPLADAPRAIARLREAAWAEFRGIHLHLGSQLFDLAPWREALRAVAGLGEVEELDLGGGLAVAYTDHQRPPSAREYVDALAGTARAEGPAFGRLAIEPGRALVARACVTLYRVEGVKDLMLADGPARFVAVDGGMSDNLRPMLYDAVYEADLVDRMGEGGSPCAVVGKHCESGDVLIRETALPRPRPGDVLATPVTGAYGYAMASNYNGVPRAPVVFCSGGEARLVVRRETFEDLHARDV
jgi:diaminopimelate decarboxylase